MLFGSNCPVSLREECAVLNYLPNTVLQEYFTKKCHIFGSILVPSLPPVSLVFLQIVQCCANKILIEGICSRHKSLVEFAGLWAQGLMFFCSLSHTGVYFDSCVRQIKFVDFCGKYRLPLMHYLCSPECSSPFSSASQSSTSQSESDSEDEASVAAHRMQKVLLG